MDVSERLIAESLLKHASDAPSSEHLLAAVRYRRTLRTYRGWRWGGRSPWLRRAGGGRR
ncbi:hypothetical protein EV646_111310 [Kribbella antiqua]|uniref:Uncharacterized protein n=1 Tax=Kribbella antiqua TaxID=2512217 RepID=A0A4R2IIT7_9ACTN|nr:hypothetical protein EV646_111310 [Kribbella antiqua]